MSHEFCRQLLRSTMAEVRKHTTAEQRKAAWPWVTTWYAEFHGPDDYYWTGDACCKWHARAQGWAAWLEHKGLEE